MRLTLLGHFALSDGGEDRTPPPGVSAQALKLVACRGRRLHWEELVEALWPTAAPERGRTRLRNVLSRLRANAGAVLLRDGDLVVLAPDVVLDVEEFESRALRSLALLSENRPRALTLAREAVDHYGGELLPEERYTSWTVPARERLRRRFTTVVELLLADLRADGRGEEALALAERVLDVEPLVEEAYIAVAALLEDLGRRTEALRTVLRGLHSLAEVGLTPSPALLDAARRLGSARG